MPWIKRNLGFVIGGGVALALIAVAVLFLLAQRKQNTEVTQQLDQKLTQLRRLYTKSPYPNDSNIELAREQQQVIGEYHKEARRFFVSPSFERPIGEQDDEAFNSLLETTIYQLHRQAEKNRVTVPSERYSFSFEAQRQKAVFAAGSIPLLTRQLAEVEAICSILFDARINALDGIRRVPVPDSDDQGSAAVASDYITYAQVETNAVGTVAPYEFSFRAFSGELAAVLEAFIECEHGFFVKSLLVEPGEVIASDAPVQRRLIQVIPTTQPTSPQRQRSSSPYDDEVLRQRYGLDTPGGRRGEDQAYRERYGIDREGRPPPPVQPAQPLPPRYAPRQRPSPTGPETILKEGPLQVTLLVDVVRLNEPAVEPAVR